MDVNGLPNMDLLIYYDRLLLQNTATCFGCFVFFLNLGLSLHPPELPHSSGQSRQAPEKDLARVSIYHTSNLLNPKKPQIREERTSPWLQTVGHQKGTF